MISDPGIRILPLPGGMRFSVPAAILRMPCRLEKALAFFPCGKKRRKPACAPAHERSALHREGAALTWYENHYDPFKVRPYSRRR